MDKESNETCEQLLREIVKNKEPWAVDRTGFVYCFFCLSLDEEMTHADDCVYVRARKHPTRLDSDSLKACRPLVVTLYANPQRQRKESVMDYERKILCARYHNLGTFAIAVVAVVNYRCGWLFDWTAYIGGCADVRKEQAAIAEAVLYGNKMSKDEAAFYFPNLSSKAWRP